MMNKKIRNIFIFILFLVVFAFQGFAQKTSAVAVVNPEKVFQNSNEGKKALSQLQEKRQKIKNEISGLDNQILSLETKLKTQRLTLTYEASQQLTIDLDSLKTKRKRFEEDSAKEFQQLEFSLYSKFRNEVLPIIDSLAKEKEFSLVLDLSSGAVVYFDTTFNITDEVIRRYDASKTNKSSRDTIHN